MKKLFLFLIVFLLAVSISKAATCTQECTHGVEIDGVKFPCGATDDICPDIVLGIQDYCQTNCNCDDLDCIIQPTSEIGLCNNGLDDDKDNEWDYDTLDRGPIGNIPPKGDKDCSIEVTQISAPSTANENSNIDISCTTSIPNINSVQAFIGAVECSGDSQGSSWSGNTFTFKNCNTGSAGTKTIKCTINSLKSYQSGTDKTQQLTVSAVSTYWKYLDSGNGCKASTSTFNICNLSNVGKLGYDTLRSGNPISQLAAWDHSSNGEWCDIYECAIGNSFISNCQGTKPTEAGVLTGASLYPSGYAKTSWTYDAEMMRFVNPKLGPCRWACDKGYAQSGNTCASITTSDTTPPTITNILIPEITQNSAKINWTTNEDSNSTVVYGTTTDYDNIKEDAIYTKDHSITLTQLTPNTYHYKICSTDRTNNKACSDDSTFTITTLVCDLSTAQAIWTNLDNEPIIDLATGVSAGTQVKLYLIDSKNCNTKTVNFEVFESDRPLLGIDSTSITQPISATITNNIASTTWTTQYKKNDGASFDTVGDPEFLFQAVIGSTFKESSELTVKEAVVPSIRCGDNSCDLNNEDCFSCQTDCGTCPITGDYLWKFIGADGNPTSSCSQTVNGLLCNYNTLGQFGWIDMTNNINGYWYNTHWMSNVKCVPWDESGYYIGRSDIIIYKYKCVGKGTPPIAQPPICTPESDTAFCSRLGKNCGTVTANDNCGNSKIINCGTCTLPETCGGGGIANVCGTQAVCDVGKCNGNSRCDNGQQWQDCGNNCCYQGACNDQGTINGNQACIKGTWKTYTPGECGKLTCNNDGCEITIDNTKCKSTDSKYSDYDYICENKGTIQNPNFVCTNLCLDNRVNSCCFCYSTCKTKVGIPGRSPETIADCDAIAKNQLFELEDCR